MLPRKATQKPGIWATIFGLVGVQGLCPRQSHADLVGLFCTPARAMVSSRTEQLPRAVSGSVVLQQPKSELMSVAPIATKDRVLMPVKAMGLSKVWPATEGHVSVGGARLLLRPC